jgi:hypothetical protein
MATPIKPPVRPVHTIKDGRAAVPIAQARIATQIGTVATITEAKPEETYCFCERDSAVSAE